MDLEFRKQVLLMGLTAAVGMGYVPAVYAEAPSTALEAVQQAKKITGTVVDSEGPIIGASIMEQGTTNGTVTDLDGNFTLNVKPGATLEISYIGYEKQIVKVGNQNNLQITMRSSDATLNEVVVVGYGVQKKKLVTGATVEVKGDDITKLNTTQVLWLCRARALVLRSSRFPVSRVMASRWPSVVLVPMVTPLLSTSSTALPVATSTTSTLPTSSVSTC